LKGVGMGIARRRETRGIRVRRREKQGRREGN